MYKFNSSTLVGGYIKQLLHSFYLPTCKIYTKENRDYSQKVSDEIAHIESSLIKLTHLEKEDKGISAEEIAELNQRLEYLKTHRELNIIPSYYRNTADKYPNPSINNIPGAPTIYPENMTYVPYLKDGILQEYIKQVNDDQTITEKWIACHADVYSFDSNHEKIHKHKLGYFEQIRYQYGKPYLNWTKNLKLDNNVYDCYTHEYLGDYLRFLRDYHDVNLMSMYNCFSDNLCNLLNVTIKNLGVNTGSKDLGKFTTRDKQYKIYMIPVKLFKKYTIAIDCPEYIEMFCGIYDLYLNNKISDIDQVYYKTYKFYNHNQFKQPVLYDLLANIKDTLNNDALLNKLMINENNLKLFIKIPAYNKSSITILEGDYTNYTGGVLTKVNTLTGTRDIWERRNNHYVFNFEYEENTIFKPITNLQLLKMNTQESYPFADKLVEYLLGSVVNKLDQNADNIKRAQSVISDRINYRKAAGDYKLDTVNTSVDGFWRDIYAPILYNYINQYQNTEDENTDITGDVDSTVEKLFVSGIPEENTSIANADIYESEDGQHEWY